MTRSVSSERASLAPGTSLLHSGESLNASSALQLLETRMPDQAPDFAPELAVELVALACWAVVSEPGDTRGAKKRIPTKKIGNRLSARSKLIADTVATPSFSI